MTTLADFVVITTGPEDGKAILTVRHYGYLLLGGAVLYDLIDRGSLGLSGQGGSERAVVCNPASVPEPSLEYYLASVRDKNEQRPHHAVQRLGGGLKLREGIYGGLVQEGVLSPLQITPNSAGFSSWSRTGLLAPLSTPSPRARSSSKPTHNSASPRSSPAGSPQ